VHNATVDMAPLPNTAWTSRSSVHLRVCLAAHEVFSQLFLISEALCAHQGTAPRRSVGGQRAVSRIVRDIMCCAVVISDVERLAATVKLLLHSCTCCMCCLLLQTGTLYRLEALDLRVRGLLQRDVCSPRQILRSKRAEAPFDRILKAARLCDYYTDLHY